MKEIRLKTNCVLLVKLFNPGKHDYPKWLQYRGGIGRDLVLVQDWLKGLDSFRYCIIYLYDRKTKQRGNQVGYIDKYRIQYGK